MKMTDEQKKRLVDEGREDLIRITEANEAGYAGCMPNGNLVDRREHPEGYEVPANRLFEIAPPKKVGSEPFFLDKNGHVVSIGNIVTRVGSVKRYRVIDIHYLAVQAWICDENNPQVGVPDIGAPKECGIRENHNNLIRCYI